MQYIPVMQVDTNNKKKSNLYSKYLIVIVNKFQMTQIQTGSFFTVYCFEKIQNAFLDFKFFHNI